MGRIITLGLGLFLVSGAPLLGNQDRCEVSVTDLDMVRLYLEERLSPQAPVPPQPEVLGRFSAEIAEERMTTRQFKWPVTGEYLTASVFYTDESVALTRPGTKMIFDTSMTLALLLSPEPVESAVGCEGNVEATVGYTTDTLYAQVTKIITHAQYEAAEDYSDGRAVVRDAEGRYSYIDTQGVPAFEGRYDVGSPFFKGLAHVELIDPEHPDRNSGTYAYIDTEGKVVFSYKRSVPRE